MEATLCGLAILCLGFFSGIMYHTHTSAKRRERRIENLCKTICELKGKLNKINRV